MPHTRAAQLRALQVAAECAKLQQILHNTTNIGWNDYVSRDLPGLTYQSDGMAWYPSEEITFDQNLLFQDIQTSTVKTNALPESINGPSSTSEFYDTQLWNLIPTQESLSVTTPAVSILQPCPETKYTSYKSNPINKDSRPAHEISRVQTLPPKSILQTSSLEDKDYSRKSSAKPALELTDEFCDISNLGTDLKSQRVSNANMDAGKKRKLAHSVIEKHYRSKIKDAMAELRHCVPSAARVRSSYDSKRSKRQEAAENASSDHSSKKVAILSDAVEYVKALEVLNEALHGRLDVMQRRNHTLQKIALSKT